MRSLALLVAIALVACSNDIGARGRADGGPLRDGASPDAAIDGALDALIAIDAPLAIDATAETDAAAEPCAPLRRECRGELECGAVPDGCPGGALDCGECGGGETWCAVLEAPRWRSRVWPCVLARSTSTSRCPAAATA